MGNGISSARMLTVSSFLVNFGVQFYGMITTPNMKDIAEANHYAFSPNPWFIAAFFSGQVILQLAWIRKLFKDDPPAGDQAIGGADPSSRSGVQEQPILQSPGTQNRESLDEGLAWQAALNYAPVYALGNFCIAGWLFFWLRQNFVASQVLVTINTLAQLIAVSALPPLTPSSPVLHRLTHLVAKTFAGIGVLDLIDNGGVVLRYHAPPSAIVQAATYTFFPLAAASSSPLFSSVLLYDVVAVAVGQIGVRGAGPWPARLGWTSLATSVFVGLKVVPTIGKYMRS